jgi:hypothetical protein
LTYSRPSFEQRAQPDAQLDNEQGRELVANCDTGVPQHCVFHGTNPELESATFGDPHSTVTQPSHGGRGNMPKCRSFRCTVGHS